MLMHSHPRDKARDLQLNLQASLQASAAGRLAVEVSVVAAAMPAHLRGLLTRLSGLLRVWVMCMTKHDDDLSAGGCCAGT